jgi:flagellar hook-length control protein FliK
VQIISGLGNELSARPFSELQPVNLPGGTSFEEYLKQSAPPAESSKKEADPDRDKPIITLPTRSTGTTVKAPEDREIDRRDDLEASLKKKTKDVPEDRLNREADRKSSRKAESPKTRDGNRGDSERKIPEEIDSSLVSTTLSLLNRADSRAGEKTGQKSDGSSDGDSVKSSGRAVKAVPKKALQDEKVIQHTFSKDKKSAGKAGETAEVDRVDRDVPGDPKARDGRDAREMKHGDNAGKEHTQVISLGGADVTTPAETAAPSAVPAKPKAGPGKVQLQRETERGSQSRLLSHRAGKDGGPDGAPGMSGKSGAAGKAEGVYEMELDLSEETLRNLVEEGADDGEDTSFLRDEGEGDKTTFLARMEQPTVQQSQRQIGTHQAAGTLARKLNGDLGSNIVRQAKIMLSESDKAEIRLIIRPPELGRVRINLQMENGHIAGRILVDNGSVREVMEQNLPALQRAFAEAGLDVGSFEVATGDSRQDPGTDGERNSSTGNGRRSREGAGAFSQSIESIEVNDYAHRRINLVA